METWTWYFSSHSRQVNVTTWFLVLLTDKENTIDYREGDIYIHIYIIVEFLASHFSDLSRFTGWTIIEELSVRRRLRIFLISWGQKTQAKACKTLLCWFIVMIRVLVCNNMYQYEHHFGSFYHNPTILDTVSIHCQQMGQHGRFFLNTTTGNNFGTDVSLLRKMWKSYVKINFHICISFPMLACRSEVKCQTTWY